VFGRLARSEQTSATSAEVLAGFTAYLQELREQGLVRTDLSLQALATIFTSVFVGFFLAVPLLPGAFKPSDEELAELIGETGHRALEPRDPASSGAIQLVSTTLTRHLDRSVALAQQDLTVDAQRGPATIL
jgi:hypothetical protein